jgi:DNA-binding transcriptional ArsR family regulator
METLSGTAKFDSVGKLNYGKRYRILGGTRVQSPAAHGVLSAGYAAVMDIDDQNMSEGEAALAALLEQLWRMVLEAPSRPCSLARVGKRTQLPMSTLMRALSLLSGSGLVEVAAREEGGGQVTLTAAGRDLCAAWFGAQPPTSDMRTTG